MNRGFLTALAATSIAVALLVAASVAYRVFDADAAGRRVAKADFETLRYSLSRARTASDLGDAALRGRLMAQYRASPNLLLVAVYERGAGVRWRIPAYSPYLPAAENVRPSPQPSYPPRSAILLSAPLPSDPTGLLAVDALYRTVDQRTVFLAFRDALLAIAVYLALAALAIAIAAAVAAARGHEDGDLDEALARRLAMASGGTEDETRVPGLDDPDAEFGSASEFYTQPEEEFSIPEIAETETRATAGGGVTQRGDDGGSSAPSGLFSPASGLGWANYLTSRLDAELERSASFEQDLSLLVLHYDGMTKSSEAYAALAHAVGEFFSFRDLAFEQGEDGFAIILPNIDAEHALRMSEEFIKKLGQQMKERRDRPEPLPVFMGLSSRTGRLVDSERIMQEATAALQKARSEGDSRIVAFRPDPDKYRLFLASKGCA